MADGQTAKHTDLASIVFNHRVFAPVWCVFLLLVLLFVTEPIRLVILVYWVSGGDAYWRQGMRVIPHKPLRFSDGTLVPQLADIVAGAGMFFLTTIGLSLGLFLALRFYERRNEGCRARRQR
jgi:hypothetical protein